MHPLKLCAYQSIQATDVASIDVNIFILEYYILAINNMDRSIVLHNIDA
jgi:hypothetical protein